MSLSAPEPSSMERASERSKRSKEEEEE